MDHPDRTLLQTFVATRHSDDFTPIVRQYLNLVYSTALRLVSGDHSQAEDICQNVFTDLVRKADRIPEAMPLAAWLYRHTSFLAANVRRAESRRLKRETEANAMAEKVVSGPVEIPGEELHLALNELAEADRDILVLRFFEELDLRRVGLRFGIGEDAAQKRVSRALERLRQSLGRFGISTSVAGLMVGLSRQIGACPLSAGAVAEAAVGGAVGWTAVAAGAVAPAMLKWAAAMTVAGLVAVALFPRETETRPVATAVVESAGESRGPSSERFESLPPESAVAEPTGNPGKDSASPATVPQARPPVTVEPISELPIKLACRIIGVDSPLVHTALPFAVKDSGGSAVLPDMMMTELLEAVAATNGLRVVSSPQLIVSSGQEAQAQVMETRTVVLGTAESATTGAATVVTTNLNLGTVINLTAERNPAGDAVTLQVAAEVNAFAGYVDEELQLAATPVALGKNGETLPVVDRATVNVGAAMYMGQTLLVAAKTELLEKRYWFLFTPSTLPGP